MKLRPTRLVILRHFPTDWNQRKILQGRADIPLSEASVAAARQRRLPSDFQQFELYSSPLLRARQTAELLSARQPLTDDRLMERSYGSLEGQAADLFDRSADPNLGEPGWRGLAHKAPDGESLAEVMVRVSPWLEERAASPNDTLAVTHRGVMAAVFALATGWDGLSEPRPWMENGHFQAFQFDERGVLRLERVNIPF